MNSRRPSPVTADERPGALRLDPGRLDAGHWQAGGPQRGRDPVGSDPPVGHAEGHQHAGADGHPGGEREYQFGRQDSAGDQPGRGRGTQRDPCRPAPGTAQPRGCGHGDRCRRGEQGRAGKRRAGQPRAVPGSGRDRVAGAGRRPGTRCPRARRRPRRRLRSGRPAGGTGGAAGRRRRPRRPRRRRPPAAGRSAAVRPGRIRARSRQPRRDRAAGGAPPRRLRASRSAPAR